MTRDDAYRTLYSLIFRGFLIGEMEMGKSLFVFKTVTEKEFDLVRACSGNQNTPGYLSRFNMYFLAHSTFAIDGENILASRGERLPELASFFSQIPGHVFRYVMSELEKMRNDCYDILKYMEGFCYTSDSRRLWKSFKNMPPNSEQVTGIPGTALLGLNVHQESWIYVNQAIDEEERYDREFSLSLLIASASNPKGAKQTRAQHDSHAKTMEDHRKKLAEVGYIDTKNWSEAGWAASVDTAEELVAELDRQMKGMKDRHDRFIDDHLKKIRDEAERKVRAAEDRIKASKAAFEDIPDLTGSQRPLTAEETAMMVYNNRRRPTTMSAQSEESVSGEASDRILKKMGSKVLTARR